MYIFIVFVKICSGTVYSLKKASQRFFYKHFENNFNDNFFFQNSEKKLFFCTTPFLEKIDLFSSKGYKFCNVKLKKNA